ncbi:MAG: aspartate aminotransferase family protein [Chitinophagales bacterium]|nr:aspartate aminotransferase family protein [Chitinophagales bacterium]MDW8428626.1 aspartate aminotransferase family protein [Chitinophagales bacterium]
MSIIITRKEEEAGQHKLRLQSERIFARRRKLIPNALSIFTPATVQQASGAYLTDADGYALIDFTGGIGVLNAGHCPPPVVRAIQEQAGKFLHTCFGVAAYDLYLDVAERLVELFPHGEATKVMLTNSGAESVENAIKIARQYTKRPAVICYTGSFHGRSLMATSLTSKVGYRLGCGPFAPEVYRLAFPDFVHDNLGMDEDAFTEYHLRKLDEFFYYYVSEKDVAAIIIECVQGEGGFNVLPKKYLQGLRRVCDQHGIVLIIDEVQTGFCRTGKWAAYQHYDVVPDISTWAKSIASGMPLGAVIGRQHIMDGINPGTIGGTFLGNPVCCAAALATIQYMKDMQLNERAQHIGSIIRRRFEEMQKRFPKHISNVRGLGAMMALELSHEGDIRRPNGELGKAMVQRCHEKGLILITAGAHGNILRILSPLVIEEDVLHRGLDIIEESLAELVAQ